MSMRLKLQSWIRHREGQDAELDRLAVLREKPARNPPHLTIPTRVRRIGRGFTLRGRAVAMGEVVVVEASVAAGLVAMNRAELVP
jgi:hypothetical protein